MTSKTKKWFIVAGIVALCLTMAAVILARLSGQLLKAQIEKALGDNVKAGAVSLSWGKVIIEDLTFHRDGQAVGNVKTVQVRADFMSILGDTLKISSVDIDQPYFKLIVDNKGKLLLPVVLPEKKTGEGKQKAKHKDTQKDTGEKGAMPVEVKNIAVRNGKVDFEDRSPARPVLLKFDSVMIDVHDVAYPFSNQWTDFELSSRLTGGSQAGSITATGKTNLLNDETKVKTAMKNIDLAMLRPYLEKKGDAGIERGSIHMNMDASIVKKHIRAPGTMIIKDLGLASSGGIGGTFLGIPRSMVLSFLKNNNNEISLDFTLEGDLGNPQFNIRENLATRLSVGLANKLGVSIIDAGGLVAGGGGKIIEGTTKTLKGIFKR